MTRREKVRGNILNESDLRSDIFQPSDLLPIIKNSYRLCTN